MPWSRWTLLGSWTSPPEAVMGGTGSSQHMECYISTYQVVLELRGPSMDLTLCNSPSPRKLCSRRRSTYYLPRTSLKISPRYARAALLHSLRNISCSSQDIQPGLPGTLLLKDLKISFLPLVDPDLLLAAKPKKALGQYLGRCPALSSATWLQNGVIR